MSSVLEKTFSGLVSSVFGTSSTNNPITQSLVSSSGLKNVSLGLVHFVEKLQAAYRISKQEEEHCVDHESREWVKLLSSPGVSSSVVADIMCRALIASVRGYPIPSLHIHAIKLTQSSNLLHKKIGYLFVSQSLGPGSELTLLLVNTIQRDLAAPNALQVAAALSSLPTVVTPDITPVIVTSLTQCLAHHQAYIRRRAAAMVGMVARRSGEEIVGDHIPHLLHLLTDQDPAVAMAAVCSLAKVYKVSGVRQSELRDQVARSAANLMTQALKGALPKDYHVNTLPAPFPQIQMLRVVRDLSSSDWDVPSELREALGLVLTQPLGGKEMGLYAVLLECIYTITALPPPHTHMTPVLKVVLGLLKSSCVDLKYVGVRALAGVFRVLEDALTPAHLEAVMDCLYHSSTTLQTNTLHLLCAMANAHNYQAVCNTLQEFSSRTTNIDTHNTIMGEMASIIKRHCSDVAWGVDLLSPLVLSFPVPDKRLTNALMHILEKGFQEEGKSKAAMEASQELLLKMFGHSKNTEHLSLIAMILNLHYSSDPKQVSKYFTDSLLEKLKVIGLKDCDSSIFQCLKNIGLNDESVRSDILLLLKPHTEQDSNDMAMRHNSTEICRWLANPKLSLRVIKRQEAIISSHVPLDLTLSFLDHYVLKSLEGGGAPFKPLGIALGSNVERPQGSSGTEMQTSTGSDDGHSSTPSTGITSATSLNSCQLSRSLVAPNRRVWSSEGRVRPRSEGEETSRPRFDSGCEPDGLHKTILRDDEEDEDEVTEGSVELADEAQEDEKAKDNETSNDQRLQLTQALLAGLGMARAK
ncbi:hypothetical protein Pmani_036785 [Petrolisthes manimaculis]|uniref:Clathrin/coatomer adaptor adaptin-like N-terminal domain-containing protein n=1 Tax=Petrolisthes manimaculis TaxID=1843537 RepID=A0AAE1NHN2_9EUCA|nr:hypothetical protein Pmani_036785 [Petrolisthes manimaculis]